ncbi:MAG: beta-phosphoglucomutase [Cognaticolwellia sp.]|jgi:beta-phosphoglucomutase|tara:strand:- start:171 stop:815 length:645 start_codon:yes stop_codon:yes gene_type:complete
MIKACIFDLDGVITDTAEFHFIAWRKLANSLNFDFNKEFNETLKGVSRIDSLEMILKLGGVEKTDAEIQELAVIKNDWYVDLLKGMTQDDALPGVRDLLIDLKAKGYKIGLGSASKNAVPVLKFLDMLDFFEVIIDGTKTTKGKPDPQVFQMGAKALGVKPEDTVVFEDAVSGVQAALNGGFTAVGCGSPENLGHAHHVVAGLNEVTEEWISKL